MTIKKGVIKPEDYIIQVKPLISRGNRWTGQVLINIICSENSTLPKEEREEVYHLCKMMCSLIPLMQYDPELMDRVDDFTRSYDEKEQIKEKKRLTVVEKECNVIKIDFLTKTEGSA